MPFVLKEKVKKNKTCQLYPLASWIPVWGQYEHIPRHCSCCFCSGVSICLNAGSLERSVSGLSECLDTPQQDSKGLLKKPMCDLMLSIKFLSTTDCSHDPCLLDRDRIVTQLSRKQRSRISALNITLIWLLQSIELNISVFIHVCAMSCLLC